MQSRKVLFPWRQDISAEGNKQEICLKMLDFANSETRNLKVFWYGILQEARLPRKLA